MPSRACPDLRSPSEMESERLYQELSGPNRNNFQWDDVVITSIPNLLCFDDSKAILLNSFNFNKAKHILNNMYSLSVSTTQVCDIDEDIIANSQCIKLDDPITLTKLALPSRGLYCQHMQCFDFDSYLFINKKKPKSEYVCPICSECCNPGNVYIDYITLCFVHLYNDQNIEGIPTVVVMSDGTYNLSQNNKSRHINNIPKIVINDRRLSGIVEKYGEKITLADLSKPTLDDVLNQINKSEDTLLQSLVQHIHPTINIAAGIGHKRPFYASTLQGLRHDIQGLSNGIGPCKAHNVISSLVTHVWKVKAELVALVPGANLDNNCPSTESATTVLSVGLANRDLCDINTITSSVSYPIFVSPLMLYGIADTTTIPKLGRVKLTTNMNDNNIINIMNKDPRHTSAIITDCKDHTKEHKRPKQCRSRSQSLTENAKVDSLIAERDKKLHKKARNDNQIIIESEEILDSIPVLVEEVARTNNKSRSRSQSLKDNIASIDASEVIGTCSKEKKTHKKSRNKNELTPETVDATEIHVIDDKEIKTHKKDKDRNSQAAIENIEVIDVTDALEEEKTDKKLNSKNQRKAESVEVIDLNDAPIIVEEIAVGIHKMSRSSSGNHGEAMDTTALEKREKKKERKRSRSHSLTEGILIPDLIIEQVHATSTSSLDCMGDKERTKKSYRFDVPPTEVISSSLEIVQVGGISLGTDTNAHVSNHEFAMIVEGDTTAAVHVDQAIGSSKGPENKRPNLSVPIKMPPNPPTVSFPVKVSRFSTTISPPTLAVPSMVSNSNPPSSLNPVNLASNINRQKQAPPVSESACRLFSSIVQAFIRDL